jgi:NADH-quinone oxidoreductase subunit L
VPGAALAFFCGAAALAGLPPFSGFFSKGRILEHALETGLHQHGIWMGVWAAGTITALLTAIYSFRVFLLAFTGRPALEPQTKTEHTPSGMLHVLWPLALLAVIGGILNLPEHAAHVLGLPPLWLDHVLNGGTTPLAAGHDSGTAAMAEMLDAALAAAGLAIALWLYGPWEKERLPAEEKGLTALLADGFHLDRLYMAAVARPYRTGADALSRFVESGLIDHSALGIGNLATGAGERIRRWGADRLSSYLLWLLLGVIAMLVILAAIGIR